MYGHCMQTCNIDDDDWTRCGVVGWWPPGASPFYFGHTHTNTSVGLLNHCKIGLRLMCAGHVHGCTEPQTMHLLRHVAACSRTCNSCSCSPCMGHNDSGCMTSPRRCEQRSSCQRRRISFPSAAACPPTDSLSASLSSCQLTHLARSTKVSSLNIISQSLRLIFNHALPHPQSIAPSLSVSTRTVV
jgi:hypothetical protein